MTLVSLLCAILAAPLFAAPADPVVIAIDAGHGGKDLGAVVRSRREKEIVLRISRRLADRLSERAGYSPYLTRWSDEFVPLTDRVRRAEAVNAKAFVSIHADKVYRRKGRGAILYVYGRNKRIPKGPPRPPTEEILPPPPRSQVSRSRVLADDIRRSLRRHKIKTVRYVDKGGYAVLKSSSIPSVLLEVGNLRDKKEAPQMCEPAFQERLAEAVASGIVRFLRR